MSYPTDSLSKIVEQIDNEAISLKVLAQNNRDVMASGSVPVSSILELYIRMRNTWKVFDDLKSTPGLADYAKTEKNDAGLDVVAEFIAMMSAIDAVVANIAASLPTHNDGGNDYLLAYTLGPDGHIDRQFTTGQTAGLRTVLDALIATIGS